MIIVILVGIIIGVSGVAFGLLIQEFRIQRLYNLNKEIIVKSRIIVRESYESLKYTDIRMTLDSLDHLLDLNEDIK